MSIKDIITLNYGYKYEGRCTCDGFLTEKYYRDGGYQLRLRVHKYTFKVKLNRRDLTDFQPLDNLETYLTNLHNDQKESIHAPAQPDPAQTA